MKKTIKVFGKMLLVICILLLASNVIAAQYDAPFYDLQEKNKAKWAEEDKQINKKLEALEKKFGKKPNIIYVLADDVGWGEMGWQGGGKHRGTPAPLSMSDPSHLQTSGHRCGTRVVHGPIRSTRPQTSGLNSTRRITPNG